MILENKEAKTFEDYSTNSFITSKQLLSLIENKDEFKEDLIEIFQIDENKIDVLKVGNSKFLLDSLLNIDSQCEKIDIITKIKNLNLKKMLNEEKALFEIFEITDSFILKENKSDSLLAETRYSAKSHLVGFTKDKKKVQDLISEIKKRGLKYWKDEIPYGGINDPRTRIFVLGCDIQKALDLKEQYVEVNYWA